MSAVEGCGSIFSNGFDASVPGCFLLFPLISGICKELIDSKCLIILVISGVSSVNLAIHVIRL